MWPLISSARISLACASHSSGVSANLTPPAFIRPPVSTCDLITTGPPISAAICLAPSALVAKPPPGHGNALALEDLPALVLEEAHSGAGTLAVAAIPAYREFEAHLAPTRPPDDARRARSRRRPSLPRRPPDFVGGQKPLVSNNVEPLAHAAGPAPDRRPVPGRPDVRHDDRGPDHLRHHGPRAARAGRARCRCRTSRTRTWTSAGTSCWSRTTRARASASCT